MPLIETKGAGSAQGFGEFSGPSGSVNYIEDVFSTYLYTGNGSTQTITNGIDLSTKGGLVWIKDRSAGFGHNLQSSPGTGFANSLISNTTNYDAVSDAVTAFNVNGFSLGDGSTYGRTNNNSNTYVSWSFRKQPKFFDIVAYTGNGSSARAISHNLGSVPGAIIVKRLTAGYDWAVYHRSLPNINRQLVLNSTAGDAATTNWAGTTPTSTEFTVSGNSEVNTNGAQYVAYLFAHNAGGFGLTGSDNVISCGSFSGNTTVTLGYEPQFVMVKRSDNVGNWFMQDNMRGIPTGGVDPTLFANLYDAEDTSSNFLDLTATGFTTNYGGGTYIYIAIRRGPMKVPTTGTSVFSPIASNVSTGTQITTNFPIDLQWYKFRNYSNDWYGIDRLRGVSTTTTNESSQRLTPNATYAEYAANIARYWNSTGYQMPSNTGGYDIAFYNFRRAPGFFDVVCYTGNSVTTQTQTINHNLGKTPELIIIKRRNTSSSVGWAVGTSFTSSTYGLGWLNLTDNIGTSSYDNPFSAQPTSTTFSVGPNTNVNDNGSTYVAYLFATVAGVSKVGSYTGTGALQTINCGFTGGARFVLIKRTDSTGDWYVYDSARGISSGNDPYLFLNSSAAEVTGTNYVDTTSVGFQVTAAAPAGLNANGGTYIFLAVS